MSEDKFDVIIVGGGVAGLAASIVLAENDLEVLLVERGDYCGAKNVTGGRLYGHSLEKIIPNFADEAPIERKVVKEKISMMSEKSSLDIGYSSKELGKDKDSSSYVVLHSKFDQYLAEKAEEAGVAIITGVLVEKLLLEDGKVVGIDATGEEMYADAVIIADGVNSLLSQQIGIKKELEPNQVAVGAKEVIELSEEIINERFNLESGEGMSWLSCGDPTMGGFGGGFIYTNKDSVSIGVVATLSDIGYSNTKLTDLLERFKEHDSVAPFIKDGKTIEYSAHLVPEEGIHMVPEIYGDGFLVVGDAAGFCINLGYTVRGMDFAIESGRLAALAILRAKEKEDFSKESLAVYQDLVNDSFIMKDLKTFKGFPTILSRREIFSDLPEIINDVAGRAFTVNGGDSKGFIMGTVNDLATRISATQLSDFISTVMEAL
ncbi:FAD-dependent oxidoreductase [Anaerococcus degeneri]|uniref:FAD-dependent oxidoreductase n=3 Tax=Anaerococcus TaxID=165779 RepID=A0ABS7Z0K1_9FIRM|nr:FAD-dependent oxidoreductase [Anaerococcus degeneri]MBP2014693.1 electron transfer flavoprotein-quinone oxidoreductase [Anaerococcus degeneri]MCA2096904.1 FAD-dependent oxidoreductase [Anaerococcus degeneri]